MHVTVVQFSLDFLAVIQQKLCTTRMCGMACQKLRKQGSELVASFPGHVGEARATSSLRHVLLSLHHERRTGNVLGEQHKCLCHFTQRKKEIIPFPGPSLTLTVTPSPNHLATSDC